VVNDGHRTVSGGHGFAGIGRMQLLTIMQERARELGVELRFETEVGPVEDYARDYDLVVAADGLNSRVRSQFGGTFQARCGHKAVQVHLAGHASEVRRCVYLHFREDAAWLGLGACLSIRRPDRDLHRGMHAGDLGQVGLCRHVQGRNGRDLPQDLRGASGRACVDVECQSPARIGLDQLPARELRTLASPECGVDGGCGGDGAFFHRLRLKAGLGQCDCAGDVFGYGARRWNRPSSSIRTSGGWMCCGCNRRRAIRWSGSRRWSGIWTLIRCSSTTRF
jgi:hypothetical protein